MGKRIKPSSLLQNDATKTDEVMPAQMQDTASNASTILGGSRLNEEVQKKLEKYDALEAAMNGLTAENQELKDKAAEYAEKLSSASDEISKLMTEVESLNKKLEASKLSSNANEVAMLKKECKDLRNEADGYLVKISELTFENANLTCQLNELNGKLASHENVNNQRKFGIDDSLRPNPGKLAAPYKDAYNPYKNNGYGTW